MTTWPAALDEFEARVALAEAVLELGADAHVPAGDAPPRPADPLPPELLDRASELLDRAGAVEARLVHEQARIRGELAALRKAPAATRPGATTFSADA